MKWLSMVLALAVSAVLVSGVSAQERKRPPREGGRPGAGMVERWDMMLKGINLTDEQKAKVEELKKEYGPKIKEAAQKIECALTPEQKKARDEAIKAGREAKKDRQEIRKDIEAAVKLTDEQKAKQAEARKELQALVKEAHEKLMSILTPEQKEQLQKNRPQRGGRGGHGGRID